LLGDLDDQSTPAESTIPAEDAAARLPSQEQLGELFVPTPSQEDEPETGLPRGQDPQRAGQIALDEAI
jgi:hypothetical protein